MRMIEDQVIGVPKSYWDSVKNSVDLVEKAIKLWRDTSPQEADDFDIGMDRYNEMLAGNGAGKDMLQIGKIPATLFGIINSRDRLFWSDPKNIKVFFKTYARSAIKREIRKILVPNVP